jgi:IS5 family transposase
MSSTKDFVRPRLADMIDKRHALEVLATRMPWSTIKASLAALFDRKPGKGRKLGDADLFGLPDQLAGAVSAAGRPRLPIRLMVALLYLKHAYSECDESIVERWAQDVYFQYFSGNEFFEPRLPCDATQIGRILRVLGEAGVEQLLKSTIEAAVAMKMVKPAEFERVIVDTAVQEKAIAHPTDSRFLEVSRRKIVRLAKAAGVGLKKTFERETKVLCRKAGGHAHARQFKRLRRVVKRQRTILGIVLREVRRKMTGLSQDVSTKLMVWLERDERIQRQRPKDKNKLYALHAPEAECIGKGNARKPYEFGVKVSLAVTHKQGLMAGARTSPGNPYDGHTLRG